MINYKLILLYYLPIFLLLLISILKDRFRPDKSNLMLHNWSLVPGMITVGLFTSGHIILSLWDRIPVLRSYEYDLFIWDVATLCWLNFILFFVYICLRYVYKVSLVEAFNLKLSHFPFILKLCGAISIILFVIYYFLDFNLLSNDQRLKLEIFKSMDIKTFILHSFLSIIFAPIVEESIFRGLIYSPLYRKGGRFFAIIGSSLLWAHGHDGAILPVGIFIIGLILGWLYNRSGSLIHPIVFHMFRNSWVYIYYAAVALK